MEMVVTTTAIQHAKLQSNCHQQTNTQILQDGCPSCRPTNSVKHKCNSETTYLCLLLLRDRLRRRLCGRRGTSRLHNTNTIASTHAVLYRTITLINSFMVLIPGQPRWGYHKKTREMPGINGVIYILALVSHTYYTASCSLGIKIHILYANIERMFQSFISCLMSAHLEQHDRC